MLGLVHSSVYLPNSNQTTPVWLSFDEVVITNLPASQSIMRVGGLEGKYHEPVICWMNVIPTPLSYIVLHTLKKAWSSS